MAVLKVILIAVFLIAAIAITVVVLLQEGKSAGLGSIGGGSNGDSYWDKNKKNSLEGKFEKWTKIMAGTFVVSALLLMVLQTPSGSDAEIVNPPAPQVSAAPEAGTEEGTAPETSAAPQQSAAPETSTAPAEGADAEASTAPETSEETSTEAE